jgi:DNA-binding NtrC family response regulator
MSDFESVRPPREFHRVLIVEDDVPLRAAMVRALRAPGRTIEEASTCAAALAVLEKEPVFDLLLLDVRLPDGSGVTIAERAVAHYPLPKIIALSGEATAPEAFKLAHLGVVRFLAKPFALAELLAAIENERLDQERLAPIVRACVGRADLRDVQDGVRRTMVAEALAQSNGNRSEAAKLLRVTRQAIQKIIRNDDD